MTIRLRLPQNLRLRYPYTDLRTDCHRLATTSHHSTHLVLGG